MCCLQDDSFNRACAHGVLTTLLLVVPVLSATAAVSFGGSLGVTSDYLVRGISHNDHDASLQGDVHAALGSGFDAGVFAAMASIAPNTQRNTEVSAFVGYALDVSDAWHGRAVVNHYSYPWNSAGSNYNYDELSLDVTYQGWLTLNAVYSPNARRYQPQWGVSGVTAKSAELGAQLPLSNQFSLAAGLGYAHLGGRNPDGYAYWSAGGTYTISSVSLSLQYVGTSSGASQLYFDSAARNRVVGTVIWRF
jgi:uncharacterized protein (TIGR02001 family)